VLGALNEQQHIAPRRPSPLLLTRSSFPSKKPFARAINLDIVVGFFFENRKNGRRASMPWVAPEQGASMHRCRDTHHSHYSAFKVVTSS
jgi:hypothetical protein